MFKFLIGMFFLAMAGLGILAGYGWWITQDLPPMEDMLAEAANASPTRSTQVFAADGSVILSHGQFSHKLVRLKDVSPDFVKALLATEDRRFFHHTGVDPVAIGRAMLRNIRAKGVREGGSTITQQLVRNLFLTNERSLNRKVQEVVLAIRLERTLTKEEILELYINNVYFGEGAYGIRAASEVFFNKLPKQLTLDEGALLAGLPQAPSRYSPFVNPELAKARRQEVLGNMAEAGLLDRSTIRHYADKPFRLNPDRGAAATGNKTPYFNRYVMNEVMDWFDLDEQSFWQSDLRIYTTLDSKAQQLATLSVQEKSQQAGRTGPGQQAALVALRPQTGAILAYVGGKRYQDSQFDRVYQALRSPGSTFKIFTYTAAIERGYVPQRVYLDHEISFGNWTPQNYDKRHHGYMSMAQAFAKSNNVIAVKVMNEITPEAVVDVAQRMGIQSRLDPNLALTLGGSSVNLLEMTSAVGVIANRGVKAPPYAIERITDAQGNVLYEHHDVKRDVLSPSTADTMASLMKGVVQFGTGRAAQLDRPMAGKTGTSDEHRDAWFIGFTPDLVAGVWVGNDDNSPMGTTAFGTMAGGTMPALIWKGFMQPYTTGTPAHDFNLPYSLSVSAGDFSGYDIKNLSTGEQYDRNLENLYEQEQESPDLTDNPTTTPPNGSPSATHEAVSTDAQTPGGTPQLQQAPVAPTAPAAPSGPPGWVRSPRNTTAPPPPSGRPSNTMRYPFEPTQQPSAPVPANSR